MLRERVSTAGYCTIPDKDYSDCTLTESISSLSGLKTYYAGQIGIADRSLEIPGRTHSLERLGFWACAGINNAGVAHLAGLARPREIGLGGLPGVTRDAVALFPSHVRVNYSG